MKNSLNLGSIKQQIKALPGAFNRYSVLLFVIVLAALYAYLVVSIEKATNVQPTADATAAAGPRIDHNLVKQLENLKDNSVGVQALFSNSRTNPFQ